MHSLATRMFTSKCASWWSWRMCTQGRLCLHLVFVVWEPCFVSIMTLLFGVNNMSQTKIDAPTLK